MRLMRKIAASTGINLLNTITGRHTTSHQEYFQAFINCLNGKAGLPVAFEDVMLTNTLYLDIINSLG